VIVFDIEKYLQIEQK